MAYVDNLPSRGGFETLRTTAQSVNESVGRTDTSTNSIGGITFAYVWESLFQPVTSLATLCC